MSEDEIKQMLRDAKALENDTEERIRELVSEKDDFATLEIKGRAEAKGFGDVLLLSGDVGGLTLIARWIRSDSLTDIIKAEEFDNWCKESDDGSDEEKEDGHI